MLTKVVGMGACTRRVDRMNRSKGRGTAPEVSRSLQEPYCTQLTIFGEVPQRKKWHSPRKIGHPQRNILAFLFFPRTCSVHGEIGLQWQIGPGSYFFGQLIPCRHFGRHELLFWEFSVFICVLDSKFLYFRIPQISKIWPCLGRAGLGMGTRFLGFWGMF